MPYWYLIMLVCLADQAVKLYIQVNLAPYQSINLLPDWFSITHVMNYGAAFGIMQSQTVILTAVALGTFVFIWWKRRKIRHYSVWFQIGIAVALGGALGNCIDRLRQGYVVDFIDVHFWPIFNIADIAIIGGVGAIVIGMLYQKRQRRQKCEFDLERKIDSP
ncbi:MAG: signal peptidase II [Bacillota bacterium]